MMKMRAGLVIRFAWEKITVLLLKITTSNPLSEVNTDLAYFLWQSWGQTYLYCNYFFTDLNRYISFLMRRRRTGTTFWVWAFFNFQAWILLTKAWRIFILHSKVNLTKAWRIFIFAFQGQFIAWYLETSTKLIKWGKCICLLQKVVEE